MTLPDHLAVPSAAPGLEPAVPDLAFQALVAPFIQRLYRFLAVRLGDERERRAMRCRRPSSQRGEVCRV